MPLTKFQPLRFRAVRAGAFFFRMEGQIGILTGIGGPGLSLVVPTWRIRQWVFKENIPWLLDSSLPIPAR